jgi:imidazole glycerol phosphate synthase subunit HisF
MNVDRTHQDTVALGVNGAISVPIVASHGTGNVLHRSRKFFEDGVLVWINLFHGRRIAKIGHVVSVQRFF